MNNNLLCLAIIVVFLMQGASCSLETCPRLEFVNFPGNSLRAVDNEFINITFFVSWENCSRSDVYLVRVSRLSENNLIMDLCKIIVNNSSYSLSRSSNSCHIVSSGNNIEFSEQVKSSDTAFMFSLSDVDMSKRIDMNISIWKDSSNSSVETDTTATPTTTTTTEQQTSTTINKPDDGSIHTKDLWISLIVSVFVVVIAFIIFLSVYCLTSRAQRSKVGWWSFFR